MSLKCLKYLQQQGNTMAAVLEHGDVALYEEEQDFFQDIDLLQNHGINVADIKKLKTAGISCFKSKRTNFKNYFEKEYKL